MPGSTRRTCMGCHCSDSLSDWSPVGCRGPGWVFTCTILGELQKCAAWLGDVLSISHAGSLTACPQVAHRRMMDDQASI